MAIPGSTIYQSARTAVMNPAELLPFSSMRSARREASGNVPRLPYRESRVRRHVSSTTTCAGQIDELPAPPPNVSRSDLEHFCPTELTTGKYPKDKKPPKKPKPPKDPPQQGGQGGSSKSQRYFHTEKR